MGTKVRVRIRHIRARQFRHVADTYNYLANHADAFGIEEMTPHAQAEEPRGVHELDLFPVMRTNDVADAVRTAEAAVEKARDQTVGPLFTSDDEPIRHDQIEVAPAS